MLKVFLRENNSPIKKAAYMFMSENMATYTQEQLVKKMSQYNTTLTEADTLAALNVMKNIVMEAVKEGYCVQTPFGLLYAVAGGSTDDKDCDFSPADQNLNHTIRLRFRPNSEVIDDVAKNTQVERVSNALKTRVYIDEVFNADGNKESPVTSGDLITIIGDYLKFDSSNPEYGVFLNGNDESYRLSYYTQITAGKITARIESDIPKGTYSLLLKNKPTSSEETTEYKKKLIIS